MPPLHVHPDTSHYRLKRPAAVADIDFADPEARFEAMLRLRLRLRPPRH
ncbi:helix-turn-helix domain-containing protein [Streptomyces sp. NPDC057496]